VLDNILKLPSESTANTIHAEIPVNEVKDVNQFKTADGLLANFDMNNLNNVKVAEHVPPKSTEIAMEAKEITKEKDKLETSSNSSAITNHIKLSVEHSTHVESSEPKQL
jgi:hypothetical protein